MPRRRGDGRPTCSATSGGSCSPTGGRQSDTSHYATPDEGGDRVLDYRGVFDTVSVSGAGFGLAAGIDLVATGRYTANAAGAPVGGLGQFIFDTNEFTLFWDADGTDPTAAMLIANLAGAANWSGAEIVVV